MDILLRPIITEKMTKLGDKLNRYGFIVNKHASKLQIKDAVKAMYDVEVLSVNTMRYGSISKIRYTKQGMQKGKSQAYKKAIITLPTGVVIDFFSNI